MRRWRGRGRNLVRLGMAGQGLARHEFGEEHGPAWPGLAGLGGARLEQGKELGQARLG